MHQPCGRMLRFGKHASLKHVGVVEHLGHVLNRASGDSSRLYDRDPMVTRVRQEFFREYTDKLITINYAKFVCGESRFGAQVVTLQYLTESPPLLVVADRKYEVPSVFSGEALVRNDVRMRVTETPWYLSRNEIVLGDIWLCGN